MLVRRSDSAAPELQRVDRVDRYDLRFDASSIVQHKDGAIEVWGVATRVGVFEYDGEREGEIVREYRPPDEVLDVESLRTLEGVALTIEHPEDLEDDPRGAVNTSNYQDLNHGTVLEVKPDGDLVRVRVRISTDRALAAVRAGKVELSCGYSCYFYAEPGITPAGEVFDGWQGGIVYNHLALVDYARAGPVARLKLDRSRRGRVQRRDQAAKRKRIAPMKTRVIIDGKTYDLPELLVPGIQAKADTAAKAKRRGDAIETAAVSFETPDGKVDLVLPASAVEEMLALIGASEASEAPAAEPPPAEPPPAPGDEGSEGGEPPTPNPAADPLEDEDDEGKPRMDKKAIEAMVASLVGPAVAKAVGDALPKTLQAHEDRARQRSELERSCSPHLPAGYRFDSADDLEVALDTIEALAPQRLPKCKADAALARKGDARARGRLDSILEVVLEDHRDGLDTTGEQAASIVDLRQNADSGQRPTMRRHDQLRAERIAKMTGQAPAETAN